MYPPLFCLFVVVGIFGEMIEEVEMLFVAFDRNSLVDSVISSEVRRQENRRVEAIHFIRQVRVMFTVRSANEDTCSIDTHWVFFL